MTPAHDSSQERLDYLAERLDYLMIRMDSLANRVAALEQGRLARAETQAEKESIAVMAAAQPEKVLELVGSRALLPRTAAVSFMLVFALILRTIADNGIVNLQLGSMLGVLYASGLIFWGWRMYAGKNPLAPVFPVCGSLLLLSIILETHSRFESLPTFLAIPGLFILCLALGLLGIGYRQGFLLYLATLGASITAIALGFPNVHFPAVAALLLASSIIPIIAHRRGMSGALRWYLLVLSILFWALWSLKLGAPLSRGEQPGEYLAQSWFFPILAIFVLFHFTASILRVLTDSRPLGFFHGMLPTINVLAFYVIGANVAKSLAGSTAGLSTVAAAIAFVHFLASALLAKRRQQGAHGCNAMAFAGAALLAVSLPAAVGMLRALPIISFAAYGLAICSGRWHSGGVRFTSYLLQGFAAMVVLLSLKETPHTSLAISSLSLALMAVLQYQWCRANKPATRDSAYFAWLDRRDIGAVILLLSSLIGAFGLFRIGLFAALQNTTPGWQDAFACGQTIIINLGAAILLLIAGRLKSYEILTVCGAVVFLGAIKVFVFDLFNTKGIPLVISVFSFGIVSLAASSTLKNWQTRKAVKNTDAIMPATVAAKNAEQ